MPRRIPGLSSGSKIPLRGFTQLLKNLPPGTRAQLEQAFARAENLIDFHSRTVPEIQTRRRISGTIQKPVLTVEETIIGAFVTWDRLDDPTISFYEVQISDDSAFSTVEAFPVLEAFFSVENVTTTKFVRVRGVRANGEAGLFSDSSRIRPTITAPKAFSIEFYPGYEDNSNPDIGKTITYGKDLEDLRELPVFYAVLDETFYADRLTGGFSVWGYMSNRLKRVMDASATPWDRVRFKLNGIAVMDGYFPHWTNMMDEDAFEQANKNDFDSNGDLMSFYSLGGYTAAFGPYNVTIPNSFGGEGPNDPHRVISLPADLARFYWTDFDNTRLPSRWDQAQFEAPSRNGKNPGTTVETRHEASVIGITDGDTSDYIYFHDFRFEVPNDRTVTGIKAEIKRRQPNLESSIVSTNLGVRRPDKDIGDDVIMNWRIPSGSKNIEIDENIDVLEDVDFGRFLDISREVPGALNNFDKHADRGPLTTDARGADDFGVPNNAIDASRTPMVSRMFGPKYDGTIGTGFTVSLWFNINSQAFVGFGSGAFVFRIFELDDAPSSPTNTLRLTCQASEDNGIENFSATLEQLVTVTVTPAGNNAALDAFHHVAIRWQPSTGDGTADDLIVFLNGVPDSQWATSTTRTTNPAFDGFVGDAEAERAMGVGNSPGAATGESPLKVAQSAIWGIPLDSTEIFRVFEGKGRMDYRFNQGDYNSSQDLQHYFLFFPDQADIQDEEVFLVDQGPTAQARVRSDLDNKAKVGESWPQLGDFFYTDVRQFGFLPLPASDGIPHDNHIAIGYQDYGGEGDLWGKSAWTPAEVNNFYFGLALRVTNAPVATSGTGNAYVDHARVTLFFLPDEDRSMRATAEVSVSNQFYLEREVFGALFNIIEIGERLADLPDC